MKGKIKKALAVALPALFIIPSATGCSVYTNEESYIEDYTNIDLVYEDIEVIHGGKKHKGDVYIVTDRYNRGGISLGKILDLDCGKYFTDDYSIILEEKKADQTPKCEHCFEK